MIIRTHNREYIPQIIALSKNIEKNCEDAVLLQCLEKGITSLSHIVLINIDTDDVITDYGYGKLSTFENEPCLYIHSLYINPKNKQVGDMLLFELNKYAGEHDAKNIYALTYRNPKAFERAYGFKFECYVIKKEVS